MVRAWFLAELGRLIKFVDATKTIQDDEEMKRDGAGADGRICRL